MASKKNTKESPVFDEMIEFLSEPIFQIPIRSFMDEKCLIFDLDCDPLPEHRHIFTQYKQLVDELLEAFCKDVNLTPEQAVQGIMRLNKIPDLHDMFSGLFEQVLAADDFNIFYAIMAKQNILVQEQVIAMLLATTGIIPFSLIRGVVPGPKNANAHGPVASNAPSSLDRHEEQLMKIVIQNSKTKVTPDDSRDTMKMMDAKSVEVSQQEAKSLELERRSIEKQMKQLVIEAEVMAPPKESQSGIKLSKDASKETPLMNREVSDRAVGSADSEKPAAESSSHSAYAASLSKLSPEEIKQRQEFLRQQRDKLLAMKKEAREKQLKDAERLQSARPVSARTARSAMNQKVTPPAPQSNARSAEDEKKLAMRRAIAEKLRQEVIKQ